MKRFISTSMLALVLMAGSANAATLLSVTGGTNEILPIGVGSEAYNPSPPTAGAIQGDTVENTDASGEGLLLDGAANLIFTYLGKEAGFTNLFNLVVGNVNVFSTGTSNAGDSSGVLPLSPDGDGFLPFKFVSNSAVDLVNGAISATWGSIAFKVISATTNSAVVLAFLNDHFEGDADWDDMVIRIDATRINRIDPVPIPAALPLFLGAVGGLGLIGRWRKRHQKANPLAS